MKRRYFIYLFLAFAIIGAFGSTELLAADNVSISQQFSPDDTVVQPSIIQKVVILAAMALMPFAIMLLTSFMKMVVVLSLLRQALGVQNSPPNPVINGIAILMAIYVMFPTCMAMYNEGQDFIKTKAPKGDTAILSPESVDYMIGVLDTSKEPMRKFLIKNSQAKHRTYFFQLAKQKFPAPFKGELKATDFIIVVPAYITSQVKSAFEIGVLLYLPFFVIDLVVSNILLAMGMMMLSPLTIALPLKLLLLVMIDGWTLLIEGVVLTYR
jgi:type III secretion protein R